MKSHAVDRLVIRQTKKIYAGALNAMMTNMSYKSSIIQFRTVQFSTVLLSIYFKKKEKSGQYNLLISIHPFID